MHIAVTGASGFVGARLVEHLYSRGHQLYAYGRRPLDKLTYKLPATYTSWDITAGPLHHPPPVDAVVHCAARVNDWGSAHDFFAVNVAGTRAVLASFPAARFVYISSASVYDPRLAVSAHHEDELLPTRQRDAYSHTKLLAERLVAAHGQDAVILRPHAVYGLGETTLLPRLLRAYRFGRLFAVGNGCNRLSLTHIDNLVHAVDCSLEHNCRFGVFNVADPTSDRVDTILRSLLRTLGYRESVMYIPVPLARLIAAALKSGHRVAGLRHSPLITSYVVEQMTGNGALDITKATRQIGYRPHRTYHEAFVEIAAGMRGKLMPPRREH